MSYRCCLKPKKNVQSQQEGLKRNCWEWWIEKEEAKVAQRVVEVGCEQFFGLSGYISSPRRSRLGVRTYKHVAMLASIIQSVYIDNDWVAQQYNEQCKKRSWKKENTEEALKCWNLERIIDAEQQGKDAPSELKMEDLLNEETGMEGDSEKDAGDVTFIN
jgi:hypothetical protein